MKHILIPTDFSIHSLKAVQAAMDCYEGEQLKITLFHLLMPNDIQMLFRSMRNKHQDMVTEEFNEACQILHNRHSSRISAMNVKFGFGSTARYIQNLLEGMAIDTIVLCPEVTLKETSDRSVAMLPLLLRSGYPVNTVSIKSSKHLADLNAMPAKEIKIPREEGSYAVKK